MSIRLKQREAVSLKLPETDILGLHALRQLFTAGVGPHPRKPGGLRPLCRHLPTPVSLSRPPQS